MAEIKTMEREYVIPLRAEWQKVPNYKRTAKAVKAIKEFIARHMRVEDRDLDKVKLDVHLNNEMWYRGSRKPPVRVKVKAIKEGDIVRVELADLPDYLKFHKDKQSKKHKKSVVKKESKDEQAPSEEEKNKIEEKKKSEEQMHEKLAQQEMKEIKHTVGVKKEPQIRRKALQK